MITFYPPMVSKAKINREKVMAALNTLCPKCGCSIPPESVRRIDFEEMRCPACGAIFNPGKARPIVKSETGVAK
jgi:ribosomal protein S27AE